MSHPYIYVCRLLVLSINLKKMYVNRSFKDENTFLLEALFNLCYNID